MNEDRANKIYDILVKMCDTDETKREDFIHQHCECGCLVWRLSGRLGSSSTYNSTTNTVLFPGIPITPLSNIKNVLCKTTNMQLSHV